MMHVVPDSSASSAPSRADHANTSRSSAQSNRHQICSRISAKFVGDKGGAGIPRANFVILTSLFPAYALPLEGLAALLGIDAAIDPVRTGVNVLANCAGPVAIARWEGWRPAK